MYVQELIPSGQHLSSGEAFLIVTSLGIGPGFWSGEPNSTAQQPTVRGAVPSAKNVPAQKEVNAAEAERTCFNPVKSG